MTPGVKLRETLATAALLVTLAIAPLSAAAQETAAGPQAPAAAQPSTATEPTAPVPAAPTPSPAAAPVVSPAPASTPIEKSAVGATAAPGAAGGEPSDVASSATTGADDQPDGPTEFLSDDLSPWGMFLHADMVVKVVILGLVLASVVTWTIWLAKTVELAVAKRRLRRAYVILRGAESLTSAVDAFRRRNGIAQILVCEADDEWRRSAAALDDRDGLKERISLHLGRVETLAGRRMLIGTGLLATIGATAPFVGLFGTVWGIMNSFVGISRMHTTNLAVVAPGIAEALLATACGLVAAIPAVVIYNHFARQISGYKTLVANAAAAVMALVSRDLSHGENAGAAAPRIDALRPAAERPEGKTSLRLME